MERVEAGQELIGVAFTGKDPASSPDELSPVRLLAQVGELLVDPAGGLLVVGDRGLDMKSLTIEVMALKPDPYVLPKASYSTALERFCRCGGERAEGCIRPHGVVGILDRHVGYEKLVGTRPPDAADPGSLFGAAGLGRSPGPSDLLSACQPPRGLVLWFIGPDAHTSGDRLKEQERVTVTDCGPPRRGR